MIGADDKAVDWAAACAEMDQMEWVEPHFDRERLNIAGRELVESMYIDTNDWTDAQWYDYGLHLDVINNWRTSHAYPLLVMRMTLGNYAKKVDLGAMSACQRSSGPAQCSRSIRRLTARTVASLQVDPDRDGR